MNAEAHPGTLKALKAIEPIMLVLVPLVLVACAYLHVSSTALLSALVVIAAMVPFFLRFELTRPRPRDIMPIVVMSALGVAGRLIFAPLPGVKPVTAITIVTALSFGRQAGFLTGALIMLVSNIFFGQGPWTPWQMYALGLVGYLAGCLADAGLFKTKGVIYVFGFLASFLYGAILDTWTFVGFVTPMDWTTAIATYGAGATYNMGHAIGTVVFLLPIVEPWSRKFERIKRKYGIGGNDEMTEGTSAAQP